MSRKPALRSARHSRMVAPALALFATSLLWLAPAFAQHNGGGSPGGPAWGQNGGQPPFGRQSNGYPHGPNPGAPPVGSWPDDGGGHSGRMRGGFQLGPPGRWWNDDNFAKSLGLDRDQQHRMDEIFKASKGQLFGLYKGLRHEEAQLDKLSRAKVLDESQIDTQIDKVVQARGELEKANAHMLLEIRKQMTPEQTARLDERRPPPPPNED